ncbi:ROK family transcriptional regulator [Cohnella hongkongensis]|uniref:ROK family transcriptional regulator n=1 Tax=Cohnella hongkongensis TaxID=178337 RepID=A0ABV9FD31_9BACL
MHVKANLKLMKEINTASILNWLHREGRLTRAELARATKLSSATVSALIEELIGQDLVEEIGAKPSAGAGRKAISLQINKDGGYVIGISIGNSQLICAVLNLHGQCVAEFESRIAVGNDSMAEQIHQALADCANQVQELNAGSVMGVGIAAPGIIDERTESVLYSSLLKLNDFNLRKQVSAFFPDVPIRIVNDCNAAAFAEHYSGAGKGRGSLVYVTINEAIGAGIVLDSRIHAGFGGGAGEIGHLSVRRDGQVCNCGQRGCVETLLASPFVLSQCRTAALERGLAPPDTFDEALARYESGEAWLDPIFDQAVEAARLTIAGVVQLISPEVVVIEGWTNRSPKVSSKLRAELMRTALPLPFTPDRLLASSFGEKGALYGSATLMLEQMFHSTLWNHSGGHRL